MQSLLAKAKPPIHLTPATTDFTTASDWFRRFEGAGLDGVVAKPAAGIYEPNKRVMLKVKHERDCDCVVAGFRWHKKGDRTAVGSLLLGLFDDGGRLHHVGVCASFTDQKRLELVSSSRRIARTPSRIIRGKNGPWLRMPTVLPQARSTECLAGRVAGARGRTCRGNRCGRNWWSRLPTITCRAIASATRPNFAAGARINPQTAPSRN